MFFKKKPSLQYPYLIPWYISETDPIINVNRNPLSWGFIEEINNEFVGIRTLSKDGQTLAFLKIYTYFLPFDNNEKILIWTGASDRQVLKIFLYDTKDFLPLSKTDDELIDFSKSENSSFLFNSNPKEILTIPLSLENLEYSFEFPESLKNFKSFMAVIDIKKSAPDKNTVVIVECLPGENKIKIFPQDWFNNSNDIDYGYEWITRASRDPNSGLIHGQGIRISDFVLDKTGRNIQK